MYVSKMAANFGLERKKHGYILQNILYNYVIFVVKGLYQKFYNLTTKILQSNDENFTIYGMYIRVCVCWYISSMHHSVYTGTYIVFTVPSQLTSF